MEIHFAVLSVLLRCFPGHPNDDWQAELSGFPLSFFPILPSIRPHQNNPFGGNQTHGSVTVSKQMIHKPRTGIRCNSRMDSNRRDNSRSLRNRTSMDYTGPSSYS
jgi:hypothetical protein